MTAPEVQHVLDAIADHWPGSETSLADVPLERIDRDNSEVLEGPLHEHSTSLEEMCYVGAATADRSPEPIGTEYDHRLETVVGVRIEAAHVDGYGAIDPQKGTADEQSVSWPTRTWDSLVQDVRRAILTDRRFPNAGRSNVSYKDLLFSNETDSSSDHSDYYRYDFDVAFDGFEELP